MTRVVSLDVVHASRTSQGTCNDSEHSHSWTGAESYMQYKALVVTRAVFAHESRGRAAELPFKVPASHMNFCSCLTGSSHVRASATPVTILTPGMFHGFSNMLVISLGIGMYLHTQTSACTRYQLGFFHPRLPLFF